MRFKLFIALFLSLGSISTTAMLFWHDASKPSSKKTAPQSSVEIKWGEGSEAGVPDAAKTDSTQTVLGNNEETFVFTGICPNGEPYRLVSYQKNVGALSSSYYDYDAPVGKGTVQSDAAPKVMAVRVCRKLAEIINTHYWE